MQQQQIEQKHWSAEVEILDLKEMKLPFCDGGSEYPQYPDVETLRAKVKAADGLILALPNITVALVEY